MLQHERMQKDCTEDCVRPANSTNLSAKAIDIALWIPCDRKVFMALMLSLLVAFLISKLLTNKGKISLCCVLNMTEILPSHPFFWSRSLLLVSGDQREICHLRWKCKTVKKPTAKHHFYFNMT